MSRGFSSVFWPSMATQAARERSRPAAVYHSYSTRTTSTPVAASYRTVPGGSSSSVRQRPAYTSRHTSDPGYASYPLSDTSYGTYGRAYDGAYSYDYDYDYNYARSHTSTSSSGASGAASHRPTAHRPRRAHEHTPHDDERVSTICYGGGDVRGHRYAHAKRERAKQNANQKAKSEKRVHWADEQPAPPRASQTYYNGDNDDYRDETTLAPTRKTKAPTASKPKSPRHRHGSSRYSYSYDDEVSRRTRKSTERRW